MNNTVKNIPAMRVACIRRVGAYGPGIGETFQTLFQHIEPFIKCGAQTLFIAAYYDNATITPPEDCRADACVTIPNDLTLPEGCGLETRELPGGDYAIFMRAIDQLNEFPQAWEEVVTKLLPALGKQKDDRPCYEVYYNCGDSNPLKRWAVDFCIAVK